MGIPLLDGPSDPGDIADYATVLLLALGGLPAVVDMGSSDFTAVLGNAYRTAGAYGSGTTITLPALGTGNGAIYITNGDSPDDQWLVTVEAQPSDEIDGYGNPSVILSGMDWLLLIPSIGVAGGVGDRWISLRGPGRDAQGFMYTAANVNFLTTHDWALVHKGYVDGHLPSPVRQTYTGSEMETGWWEVDTSGGPVSTSLAQLDAGWGNPNWGLVVVENTGSAGNDITVAPFSGDAIFGATTIKDGQLGFFMAEPTWTNWNSYVIAPPPDLSAYALETDLVTLEGRVTTTEGDITTIDGEITTIDGEITSLSSGLSTVVSGLAALTTAVGGKESVLTEVYVSSGSASTAAVNTLQRLDTGAYTLTLPATPALGDRVVVMVGASATGHITVNSGSHSMFPLSTTNMVLVDTGSALECVWTGAEWETRYSPAINTLGFMTVQTPAASGEVANKGYVDTKRPGWNRLAKAVSYTASDGDFIEVDASANNVTITMPVTSGTEIVVKRVDTSAYTVLVVGASGNVDGDANASLVGQFASAIFMADGTNIAVAAVYGAPTSSLAGAITMYGGSSAPTGWLLCNGAAVSRTTYATLYSIVGTVYGAGDGSTTFNLPDLRARVPGGYKSGDTNFGTLGGTGGEATHVLAATEMPSHTHTQNAHSHTMVFESTGLPQSVQVVSPASSTTSNRFVVAAGTSDWFAVAATAVNQNTGGGGAHNNLQPYQTVNFIIKD